MDFEIPQEAQRLKTEVDEFIEAEIAPLEESHPEFFDHRREDARTQWNDGTPTAAWKELLQSMRDRADDAGLYRLALPEDLGGRDADQLTLTILKEHLARKGPGLHSVAHTGVGWGSIIGEWRNLLSVYRHGSEAQQNEYLDPLLERDISMAFGMTEPGHGSAPTYMETTAEKEGDTWVINGKKRFIGGMDDAEVIRLFARTQGKDGQADGITTFLVPTEADGLDVEYFHWTMNMPATQAEIDIDDLEVPESAVLGEVGRGLTQQGREFLIEGWLGQATMALGTAQYCIDEMVEYANQRTTFGKQLSQRQGIQFPVVDLHSETELVRNLLYKIAWMIDEDEDEDQIMELISMANYRANQLATNAADQAIQVFGGKGWTRHYPFEYLYRQFRRYRITEGADEIQKRRAAGHLFGFV